MNRQAQYCFLRCLV